MHRPVSRLRREALVPLLQLAAHPSEEIMPVDLDVVEVDLQRAWLSPSD
jgi:hypothetical protein